MKTLAIIGAGHLGQQIAHYAITDNHYHKVVFFDDFSPNTNVLGIPVIGSSNEVDSEYKNKSFDEIIIGIGYKHLEVRKQLHEKYSKLIPFGKIIHSTSWVDKTATVKAGCVIYPACCIDANVTIEENTIMNIGCTVAHDTRVLKHCFLSPRVAVAGFVTIEEMCVIGINTTIIDNISVKSQSKIGGGTVVTKSIEKSGLYVGNPHRFVR